MSSDPRAKGLRHLVQAARPLKQAVWIAPYIVVWAMAVMVLRAGALSTDCTTICLVVRGWLWYTVIYATLSLSAFVAAFEVLLWMRRLRPVGRSGAASANH